MLHTYHSWMCMSCSMQFSRNSSESKFHFLAAIRSIFTLSQFFCSLSSWFISNSNPHRIDECNGKIEYTVCYARTVNAYTDNPVNVAYVRLYRVNTQMSYSSPGIDFSSFLSFSSLFGDSLILCNVISSLYHYRSFVRWLCASHNCVNSQLYLPNEWSVCNTVALKIPQR